MTTHDTGVRLALQSRANPQKAEVLQRFFKTGKGEYGEGDIFLGVSVPAQREVAKRFKDLPLAEIGKLIKSPVHEHRFTALEILVMQFEIGGDAKNSKIVDFYLRHTRFVNNWDLVDTSAPYILGTWLLERDAQILERLARSKSVWDRRISMVTCHALIKEGEFDMPIRIAELLISDPHDLIHKAVGWMLREIGNRSPKIEKQFLKKWHAEMPRTMLRYAIEKFPKHERARYLAGTA